MSPEARDLAEPPRRSFADWSDLIVALVCTHGLMFGAGWIAHEQAELRKPKPLAGVRYTTAPTRAAFNNFTCGPRDVAEHREACNTRERMQRITRNEPRGAK